MNDYCECAEIMAADPTRHFRGCPLREKYPTHEAEARDNVLHSARKLIEIYQAALTEIVELDSPEPGMGVSRVRRSRRKRSRQTIRE